MKYTYYIQLVSRSAGKQWSPVLGNVLPGSVIVVCHEVDEVECAVQCQRSVYSNSNNCYTSSYLVSNNITQAAGKSK